MSPLTEIRETRAEGWQINAVWLVPPASHASKGRETWEARIKIPDFVPGGEGGVEDIAVTIDHDAIPEGVSVTHRERMPDKIIPLPPMSREQAEAIAADIAREGDATAVQDTASGCIAIGPTAAWCRGNLRKAIINSRK